MLTRDVVNNDDITNEPCHWLLNSLLCRIHFIRRQQFLFYHVYVYVIFLSRGRPIRWDDRRNQSEFHRNEREKRDRERKSERERDREKEESPESLNGLISCSNLESIDALGKKKSPGRFRCQRILRREIDMQERGFGYSLACLKH